MRFVAANGTEARVRESGTATDFVTPGTASRRSLSVSPTMKSPELFAPG